MLILVLTAAAVGPSFEGIPQLLSVVAKCKTSGDPNEIVVCGRRQDPRLKDNVAPQERPGPPKAELGVSKGVKLGLVADSAQVGGAQSNRAMARVKIAF